MSYLQQKFADALRREYAPAEQQQVLTVSPTVEVSLAPPAAEIDVFDTGRLRGSFEFDLQVQRDSQGLIKSAKWIPTKFHPIQEFGYE
jgi:hypothetical protein